MLFRKLVYRKSVMGHYEIVAGESVAPPGVPPVDIRFLRGGDVDEVPGSNPYLSAADVERFRSADPICIVARHGDRLAASSWMIRRDHYVTELQRVVRVREGEHFSCRSYVDESFRGHRLLSHMLYAYATSVAGPSDRLWCLIHDWNVPSARAYERVGWRRRGEMGTVVVLGRKIPVDRAQASTRRSGEAT